MKMRKKEEVLKEADKAKMRIADIDKVYDFVSTVTEKFGTFIKAVAVFGSFARKEKESKDIDVMIIVDDSFAPLDKALYVAFQAEMNSMVEEFPNLHLNTVTISQFWDSARRGDPMAIQVLRDGIPVFDLGFFAPLKRLLVMGKLRPTSEAISAATSRAFFNINAYSNALFGAVNSLFWAASEISHAGIMKYGKVPGSHWEIPRLLEQTLVNDKVITKEDVAVYEELFEMEKGISRGDISHVKPRKLEKLHEDVVRFVTKIDAWVNKETLKDSLGGGKGAEKGKRG